MGDGFDLLLGIADAGRDHRTAERVRAGFQDVAAGRQVIRERVVHDVAEPKARREQRARRTPPIRAEPLGLEDRPRRHQQALELSGRAHHKAAERRVLALQGRQVGLAQHRELRQGGTGCHPLGVGAGKVPRPTSGRHGARHGFRQAGNMVLFAELRIAALERVVELRIHPKPPMLQASNASNLPPTEPPHQAPRLKMQKTRRLCRRVSNYERY